MLLYPYPLPSGVGYPDSDDFEVLTHGEKGCGVYARRAFRRGQIISRISGVVVPVVMQHTLQITPTSHLYDPHFSGLLLHSCDPNTHLDMQHFELWAAKDIAAGEAITMDYATTEDVLFKQFTCLCKAPNCRGRITGRREKPETSDVTDVGTRLNCVAAE
jgi:hypothetical protein